MAGQDRKSINSRREGADPRVRGEAETGLDGLAQGDNVDGEPGLEGEPGEREVANLSRRHRAHGEWERGC